MAKSVDFSELLTAFEPYNSRQPMYQGNEKLRGADHPSKTTMYQIVDYKHLIKGKITRYIRVKIGLWSGLVRHKIEFKYTTVMPFPCISKCRPL